VRERVSERERERVCARAARTFLRLFPRVRD
jgi:hypothetical protein